jgi:hypothetical protein
MGELTILKSDMADLLSINQIIRNIKLVEFRSN